jgi:hypothetical protein
VVGAPVISLLKIMKMSMLLLCEVCEMVVKLAISGVEEKINIRERPLYFVVLNWRRR